MARTRDKLSQPRYTGLAARDPRVDRTGHAVSEYQQHPGAVETTDEVLVARRREADGATTQTMAVLGKLPVEYDQQMRGLVRVPQEQKARALDELDRDRADTGGVAMHE